MTAEIIPQPLIIPAIAQDAMRGVRDQRYEKRPSGKEEWTARGSAAAARVTAGWLERLRPAFDAKGEAEARLSRAAAGGFVVTTGQQPGLFGGPVYTLSKALSALALANALEKLTSLPVSPVFWAATDDTDFREASKTVIALPGGARELVMEAAQPVGSPMSTMPLGGVGSLVSELSAASGSGADAAANAWVKKFYSASNTVGGAYVELLRELFAPLGIAVLDASHEAVREASSPLVRLALERGDEIAKAITANNASIERDGFSLQVQDVSGLSLVFENTPAGRKRIPRKRAARDIGPGADLGPNVLLRPIVESQILPTAAYVGGPAEIAYFAQLAPIADVLGVARPLIVPRWSCTVVEPHVREILQRLGVGAHELQDPHAAETRVARERLPDAMQKELVAFRNAVSERAASLAASVEGGDPLIAKTVVEGLRHNLAHRIDRFERRLIAACKRRNADLMHDIATARGSLFPFGRAQERALSFIPFLARYGKPLPDAMLASADEHVQSLL